MSMVLNPITGKLDMVISHWTKSGEGIHYDGGSMWCAGTTGGTPVSGAGKRLMWIPAKGAFRAGCIDGNQWNDANIGDYSVAFGYSGIASGLRSTHFGNSGIASGMYSAHFGYFGMASEYCSIHFGREGTASGQGSTHFGYLGTALGNYSTHFGYNGMASGMYSTHFGYSGTTPGICSIHFGSRGIAAGNFSWVGGKYMQLTAAADRTFVFGYHTSAVSVPIPDAFLVFPSGTLGNMGLGTMTFGTNANAVFGIGNGVAPTSSPTNMVQLYAEDVGGSSELKARDEAGNISTLSPHSFVLFPQPDPMAWAVYSKNPYLGKEINVDMWSMVRYIEELSGRQFIYIADLPPEQVEDKEAELREVVIFAKMQEEVEIPIGEATEQIPIMDFVELGTKIVYELNRATGELEEFEKPDTEEQPTGEMEYKLLKGSWLNADTGKSYRRKTREEAELELGGKR